MARRDTLKKKIETYSKKGQLLKSESHTKLERPFLLKARKNLTVGNLLFSVSDNDEFKKLLHLTANFESFEWVIIIAYYAMYVSSLAALAKLGFKSKSHAATISVLEYYYVHAQKHLDPKHINQLAKAYLLSENLVLKLIQTKTKREMAQYDATPAISLENAHSALADAEEFITRIEEVLDKK